MANATTETSPASPAVALDGVCVSVGGVDILDSVTATIPRASTSAIIGPNGAGKTTLLLAMLGQMPHRGTIRLAGRVPSRPPRLGYVPQRLMFDRALPLTVLDLLVLGAQRLPLWFGIRRRHRDAAFELLAAVRAEHLARRRLGTLSGGELQRVLLALALQRDPDILILDELSAGVDVRGGTLLCELLEELRAARGFTHVLVTHDLSLVTAHATHVICLNRSVIASGPPRDVLSTRVLERTFGLHLGLPDVRALPHTQCDCPEHKR